MQIIHSNSHNYKKVSSILEDTTLKYIKNNKKFKNLSITFFIRKEADIFMSHGCADKNYREINNCEYLHKFKLILVPGYWLKKKLINLGISESKIACVGWPKLDPLFKKKKKKKKNMIKNILWLPTHDHGIKDCHKSSISSNPTFNKYLDKLKKIKNINIYYSKHPKNKKYKSVTFESLLDCDYVIADAGSTIYEAWALGIPVIFPDWIVKKKIIKNIKGSAEEYIYTNNIGYHANNINELINFLKTDLIIEKNVKKFMEEYMPSKYNGIGGKMVFESIKKFRKLF
jgi:hypothetical protein